MLKSTRDPAKENSVAVPSLSRGPLLVRLRACDYPEAGGKVQYTIPSIPVFTISPKYQLVDESTVVFDGYIRDCPELVRSYPALLKLYSGSAMDS